ELRFCSSSCLHFHIDRQSFDAEPVRNIRALEHKHNRLPFFDRDLIWRELKSLRCDLNSLGGILCVGLWRRGRNQQKCSRTKCWQNKVLSHWLLQSSKVFGNAGACTQTP